MGIGAYDDFQLNLSSAEDTSADDYLDKVAILDALQVNRQWNYALGVKYDKFTENGRWTWIASRNMLSNRAFKHVDNDSALPLTLDYRSQEMENKFRVERRQYGENGMKLTWGGQYEFAKFNNSTFSQRYFFLEDTLKEVNFDSAFDMHKYGAFLQGSKPFFDGRVTLSGGVRMDGNEVNEEMANPLRQLRPTLGDALEFFFPLELQCQCGAVLSVAELFGFGGTLKTGQGSTARGPVTPCVIRRLPV